MTCYDEIKFLWSKYKTVLGLANIQAIFYRSYIDQYDPSLTHGLLELKKRILYKFVVKPIYTYISTHILNICMHRVPKLVWAVIFGPNLLQT